MSHARFQIGDWLVDPADNCIQHGGDIRKVEPKAMDVLVFLADNQGRVVSREEIEQAVWAGRVVTTDSLSAAINKLRKALDDDPRRPNLIETVSKRGYRLLPPVTPMDGPAQNPGVGTFPMDSGETVRRRRRAITGGIAGLSLIAVLVLGLWFTGPNDQPYPGLQPLPSVVVLPFENLGKDSGQEYFSDGITDDLITELSKMESMRVIARQSAYHYKHQSDFTLADVRRDLNVGYVIQGSVQKSGSHIRINVQLTNVEKGQSVWARRFDTSPEKLFETQDRIARRVTEAVTSTLPHRTKFHDADRPTNFAAYDNFLRGQRYNAQRSKEGNQLAMDAYRESIEMDPGFARAYGALAVTLTHAYRFQWTDLSVGEARERSLELARTAVKLNQNSPQICWAMGYVRIHRKEYHAAEEAALKAVELSPNYADGYGLLAYISNWRGKPRQSEKYIKKAIDLNPFHTFDYPWNLGFSYYLQGRYEEAITALGRALERNPSALYPRLFLAASLVKAGRIDDAQWEIDNIRVARPSTTIAHLQGVMPFEKRADLETLLSALRSAGLPD